MSRLAKNPVAVPSSVTVEVNGQTVKAKGPKGELSYLINGDVAVELKDGEQGKVIQLTPRSKEQKVMALWGTDWSNIRNLLKGVNEGYSKDMEIVGVGYRANMQGRDLVISLGFSHEVRYTVPTGVEVAVEKQTSLTVSGIDKQRVGQVAAEIRGFRPPEPYKGKGIRYKDEFILRKEGKKK